MLPLTMPALSRLTEQYGTADYLTQQMFTTTTTTPKKRKLGSLSLHLIFLPGRALASRPLAIPSLLSLVCS